MDLAKLRFASFIERVHESVTTILVEDYDRQTNLPTD